MVRYNEQNKTYNDPQLQYDGNHGAVFEETVAYGEDGKKTVRSRQEETVVYTDTRTSRVRIRFEEAAAYIDEYRARVRLTMEDIADYADEMDKEVTLTIEEIVLYAEDVAKKIEISLEEINVLVESALFNIHKRLAQAVRYWKAVESAIIRKTVKQPSIVGESGVVREVYNNPPLLYNTDTIQYDSPQSYYNNYIESEKPKNTVRTTQNKPNVNKNNVTKPHIGGW